MRHILLGFICAVVGSDLAAVASPTKGNESARNSYIESAEERAALPLYKLIAAAKDSELTPASPEETDRDSGWSRSNADGANSRYSKLTQINTRNVDRLEIAWTYHSRDGKENIQANPVIVGGVIFAPTAGKSVVAIDGSTGVEIWRYHRGTRPIEDFAATDTVDDGFGPAERGLLYWAGDEKHGPRLYFIANGYLVALDAKTGRLIDTFGHEGQMASGKRPGESDFLGAVAPALYKNVIVAPNQNLIEAFDVITGRPLWQFNTLQYSVSDSDADNGGNVWGGIAMDRVRGIAFIATGDPHPNFVGVERGGDNRHSCSVIALDVITGKMLWAFQEVAHNLWDLDTSAPPNLVTVWHNGKRVDAVAQVTKLGNTLLLDRLSGKPLFPYRLRRAPVSKIPGEHTWPYQPDLELPQPFARQVFSLKDVTDRTPESREFVLRQVESAAFGWFEPPREGTPLVFYGVHGGAEWTGASFDPETGWLYVSSNEIPWIESLSRMESSDQRASAQPTAGEVIFRERCAVCHGEHEEGKGMAPTLLGLRRRLNQAEVEQIITNGRNSMPAIPIAAGQKHDLVQFLFGPEKQEIDSDSNHPQSTLFVASEFKKVLDDRGYPGTKPPWGTLNAIDLNTGKLAWKVPLGEYEELTRIGVPKTGTENFGGAMVTGGGLVFCAGTRDLQIRAFDKQNGRELWHSKLPYGGFAPPASYELNGRQYIVIAATGGGKLGGEVGDSYVAFALPSKRSDAEAPGLRHRSVAGIARGARKPRNSTEVRTTRPTQGQNR